MAFLPGDHIFIHRGPSVPTKSSIISVVQHHAIVVATISTDQVEIVEHGVYNSKDGTKKWVAGTGIDLLKEVGEVKRRTIDLQQEPGWTMATNLADAYPPRTVVDRALFLLENPSLLPPYHLTNCNGECVARWCKTGKFESTQAKGLYDKTVHAINEKVAPAVDTSGKMVSKAIAPKSVAANNDPAASANNNNGITPTSPNAPSHSSMERTQEKASTALQHASDKVVAAVKAVGAMVGNQQQHVLDKWSQTNETLDLAFAQYKSTKG